MKTVIILTNDEVKAQLLVLLSNQTTPKFISIKNYRNNDNEVSDYVINVGIDYGKAKELDMLLLSDAKNFETLDFGAVKQYSEDARLALLNASVNPSKQSEAQTDAYTQLFPNVRMHNETGRIYVNGFKISKKVLEAIDYGPDKRQPLTVAKDKIRSVLRAPKYRQYCVDKLVAIRMNGETLEFDLPDNV